MPAGTLQRVFRFNEFQASLVGRPSAGCSRSRPNGLSPSSAKQQTPVFSSSSFSMAVQIDSHGGHMHLGHSGQRGDKKHQTQDFFHRTPFLVVVKFRLMVWSHHLIRLLYLKAKIT